MTAITPPRFTLQDVERAAEEWGANCGPGALAAICGLTLDEVRPHMGGFERTRYTNPTLMLGALRSLYIAGAIKAWRQTTFNDFDVTWPLCGLARIQWEGPWTAPGVPIRVRYRKTHWVAAACAGGAVGIFDINCINNGSGWVALKDWRETVVPFILETCVPKANGKWHITHSIEVDRADAKERAA
jgi:hypothetical protein